MAETVRPAPKARHKEFKYETYLKWSEGRSGTLHGKDKPDFRVSSPPEFKGEAGLWTPEDLFVAAVDICTMTTFMAFAAHKKIPVTAYSSHAEGVMKFVDGGYQFTEIVLRPTICVETEADIERAREAIEDAHEKCLISNSITADVSVDPTIRTADC